MKRAYRFVSASATVVCTIDGRRLRLPVFPGFLKHPSEEELRVLLRDPLVARKYVREAIRKAPWAALRRFPRALLLASIPDAGLTEGRRRALLFLMGPAPAAR